MNKLERFATVAYMGMLVLLCACNNNQSENPNQQTAIEKTEEIWGDFYDFVETKDPN